MRDGARRDRRRRSRRDGGREVLLGAGVDVTLFEELPRLGGHCFAVPVPHGKGTILVDAGVSDFNRATSHEVRHFLNELGLAIQPIGRYGSFGNALAFRNRKGWY